MDQDDLSQQEIARVLQQTVWRIHLTPGHPNPINQFGFCYQRDIIGIGWSVFAKPGNQKPDSVEHYLQLVANKYESAGKEASAAISQEMNEGDLVWTRNRKDGRLYLGKITGQWDYLNGQENHDADIISIRPCKLHEVRSADVGENHTEFFSAINNHFTPATVQQIITDNALKHYTIQIWEKIQSEI